MSCRYPKLPIWYLTNMVNQFWKTAGQPGKLQLPSDRDQLDIYQPRDVQGKSCNGFESPKSMPNYLVESLTAKTSLENLQSQKGKAWEFATIILRGAILSDWITKVCQGQVAAEKHRTGKLMFSLWEASGSTSWIHSCWQSTGTFNLKDHLEEWIMNVNEGPSRNKLIKILMFTFPLLQGLGSQ